MSETLNIRPSDLLVDAENPRISQPNVGQHEALQAIATLLQRKLQRLAEDIVLHGLNPSELMIVMPFKDDLKRYVVLEGNRRLVALRSVENPEWLVDAVEKGVLKDIRKLSRAYQHNPIDSINCLVVSNRDEARHWIELRHTGENEGAGLVRWGADESARFRSRTALPELHHQALNFLERRGDLTSEARKKIPTSTFKRLIETPAVRSKLGIELQDGELRLLADERRVAKALLYIVEDLSKGTTKVGHVYTKDQRVEYADKLPTTIVVTPTHKSGEGREVGSGEVGPKAKHTSLVRTLKKRDKLIPRDCVLNVTDPRVRSIETELRNLSLEHHTNAVSVLLRVCVELSVDTYIDRWNLQMPKGSREPTLAFKLNVVVENLLARQKLTAQQATPVRRACQKDSLLAPSVTLMNQYVHNKHCFPEPSDLRAHWDNLQPFVIAVWAP